MKRVVIAGGGIIGASIAWHLTRRANIHVTLVEKSKPAAGATKDSFAWINATFSKQPRHYYELNRAGIAAWKRLESQMAKPPEIQWGGSVEWYAAGAKADELRSNIVRHRQWGYSTRPINPAELRALLPQADPGPIAAASYSDEEGVLDPVAATNALLNEAWATIQYPSEVHGLAIKDGRVETVHTSQGDLAADVLVVACGLDTPRVAGMAGVHVPLKESTGVLAHTTPQPRLLDRVALGPRSHIKQDPSGRIVAGDNFSGSPFDRSEDLLTNAAAYFRQMDTRLERLSVGWRVMPEDEYPIVGFTNQCHNLYVVATHSGITLAALLGDYVTQEIVDGVRVGVLSPYRLDRF